MKEVVVLGGPKGAGKTTAAANILQEMPGVREFVNADEIARGLSPFNPEGSALAAGRLMIERMHELIRNGESFAFETTCSVDDALADDRAIDGFTLMLFGGVYTTEKSTVAAMCNYETYVERAKRRLDPARLGEIHETVLVALRKAVGRGWPT